MAPQGPTGRNGNNSINGGPSPLQDTSIKSKLSPGARLEIVRAMGCCVPGCWHTPIELHHVRTAANSGTGMKPDHTAVIGICVHHHRQGHHVGWKTFQKRYAIDLVALAKELAQIDGPMP